MSTKPLAEAKPRNSIEPEILMRRPLSTEYVVPPMVMSRAAAEELNDTKALAWKRRPTEPPNEASSASVARSNTPCESMRKPPVACSDPNGLSRSWASTVTSMRPGAMSRVKRPSSSSTPSTTALPDRRSRTPGSMVTGADLEAAVGVAEELAVGADEEGLDLLRAGAADHGVDLEQEVALEPEEVGAERTRHARLQGQLHPPDNAGLGADEDPQVDRPRERADELDLGGHRTCQRELTAAAAGGELDLDEPDEGERPDLQLGLDRDDDVDLAVGVGRRIAAAVEARPRLEDLDRCRLTRLQQRVEGLRDLEDLVLERGVEHHRDAAAGGEQTADAGQAETG